MFYRSKCYLKTYLVHYLQHIKSLLFDIQNFTDVILDTKFIDFILIKTTLLM